MEDREMLPLLASLERRIADTRKDLPDGFVLNDGVEVGVGNKIPLRLFGFLY